MSYNQNKPSIKHFKRENIYRNSTGSLTFNPVTCEAYSYAWWVFVARIEGKIIFNNYQYSAMTRKHQCKVGRLMTELNIFPDDIVEVPNSLGEFNDLESLYLASEEYLCNKYLESIIKRQDYYYSQKTKRLEAQRKTIGLHLVSEQGVNL